MKSQDLIKRFLSFFPEVNFKEETNNAGFVHNQASVEVRLRTDEGRLIISKFVISAGCELTHTAKSTDHEFGVHDGQFARVRADESEITTKFSDFGVVKAFHNNRNHFSKEDKLEALKEIVDMLDKNAA